MRLFYWSFKISFTYAHHNPLCVCLWKLQFVWTMLFEAYFSFGQNTRHFHWNTLDTASIYKQTWHWKTPKSRTAPLVYFVTDKTTNDKRQHHNRRRPQTRCSYIHIDIYVGMPHIRERDMAHMSMFGRSYVMWVRCVYVCMCMCLLARHE